MGEKKTVIGKGGNVDIDARKPVSSGVTRYVGDTGDWIRDEGGWRGTQVTAVIHLLLRVYATFYAV